METILNDEKDLYHSCNNIDAEAKVCSVSEPVISSNTSLQNDNKAHQESKPEMTNTCTNSEGIVLSKNAMKRQRKKEQWEQNRKERRAREREKRKRRKLENPSDQVPSRLNRKQLKDATMDKSSCKVAVVVDLSFDDYMDERSLAKCIKQICRCYSINRRAVNPVQFHVSSLGNKSLVEISKNSGYKNWDVYFNDKHFMDIFPKEKIIYLTAESPNLIENIEDDGAYIIGGLVDHNSQKGLCYKLAQEKGLRHGRLPIAENIDLKTRKVLTIDHVFNIMVKVCNGQQWKEALLEVLPARKGAQEKQISDEKDSSDSNESDNVRDIVFS